MAQETEAPHRKLHEALLFRIIEDAAWSNLELTRSFEHIGRMYSEKYPIGHELPPYKILVLCDENQGRSQIEAKFIDSFVRSFGLKFPVKSAGLNATPHKYGGKPHPDVIRSMGGMGYDMSDATVDQLKFEDIDENTIVLVMTGSPIPDYVYNASVILRTEYRDPFPGMKKPHDLTERLAELMNSVSYFSFMFVLYLYESLRQSDTGILLDFIQSRTDTDIVNAPDTW